MRRVLMVLGLFLVSVFCFSQQNVPSRITGRIPAVESTQTYQIQVGAFAISQNANDAFLRLKSGGFNPVYENHLYLTRVLISNIPAGQVRNYLVRIKSLGFDEVIIREDINYTSKNPEEEGLTENIQRLIPPDVRTALENLGIEINEGRTPPNIEGTYFVSTMDLVKSTTGRGVADQWNKYVTFSRQDNTALTIDAKYTMQDQFNDGPFNSNGPGSFLVGEGNKFTVVVDGTREQAGHTAKTVEMFSGEISDAGIINYHWAVLMIDNGDNPLDHWISNGTGYSKRDSVGFSERVTR